MATRRRCLKPSYLSIWIWNACCSIYNRESLILSAIIRSIAIARIDVIMFIVSATSAFHTFRFWIDICKYYLDEIILFHLMHVNQNVLLWYVSLEIGTCYVTLRYCIRACRGGNRFGHVGRYIMTHVRISWLT